MFILTILIKLLLSFTLSVILMCVCFYLHATVFNPQVDLDSVGKIYSKKIAPLLWLFAFALLSFM